jgi:tyrosine-protein kinase Etk/Wzc
MQETTAYISEKQTNGNVDVSSLPIWLEYLSVIIKSWRFVSFFTALTMVISLIYSLFMPFWYQSSSTILIAGSSNDAFGLTKLLSGSGFDSFLGKGKNNEDVDRYESIFKSERLRLMVISKFNLMHEYELDEGSPSEPIKSALKSLDEQILFKDNKDGTISISAWFKNDSIKAADMANFVVVLIDSINRQLTTEGARNQRQFIEKRYEKALLDLQNSEEKLNIFQKKYKVAEVKDQVRASLDASAQFEALVVQSEVEYNTLRSTLGEDNPQVIQAESKLAELRRQSKKFEIGGLSSEIIIPFSKIPDLAMDYLRLYRDVMMQTKILEFLVPQYEQAKIQEAKDTPTLLILDKARVPEKKSKPKRATIILVSTAVMFLLSISFILLQYESRKPFISKWTRLIKSTL